MSIKLLNEEQIEHRIEMYLELKNLVSKDPSFIKSIIMGDETREYDPETEV